jgi:flagellar protein FliO/FliZ
MIGGFTSIAGAVAALVVVLAAIGLAARGARFAGFARRPVGAHLLEVEDVIALDTRRRVHVIRCGTRRALLVTGGACDVVAWLDAASLPR